MISQNKTALKGSLRVQILWMFSILTPTLTTIHAYIGSICSEKDLIQEKYNDPKQFTTELV